MDNLPDVKIQFVAGGVSNVLNAIKTLENAFTQLETRITNLAKKGAEERVNAYRKEFDAKKAIAERFANDYNTLLERENTLHRSSIYKREERERRYTQTLRNEAAKRGQIFSAALQSMGVHGVTAQSHISGQLMPVGGGGGMGIGSAALLAGGAAFFGQNMTSRSGTSIGRFGTSHAAISAAAAANATIPYLGVGRSRSFENILGVHGKTAGVLGSIAKEHWGVNRALDIAGGVEPSLWKARGAIHQFDASATAKPLLWRAGAAGAMLPTHIGQGIGAAGGAIGGALTRPINLPGIAVVTAALYAFKQGLDVVTGAMKKAASEMVAGVMQIGGGFSIGSSLVKSASLQSVATRLSVNAATAEERMPVGEILDWALSSARTGEHSADQYMSGMASYQSLTGKNVEFKNMSSFIGKMATVGGSSFEEMAKAMAQTRLQFGEFSSDQMQELLLKQWQAGKTGAIEIGNASQLARVTAGARQLLGGPTVDNFMTQINAVQIARGAVSSPEEAVTAYERFQAFAATNAAKIKDAGGKDVMVQTPEGEKFRDMAQTFYDSVKILKQEGGYAKASSLFGREGLRMVQAVSGQIGDKPEDEAVALIRNLLKTNASMKDLNEAYAEMADTVQYQLKRAFNELTQEVGEGLLLVLKSNMPQIQGFIKDLIKSLPALMTEFMSLLNILPIVGEVFVALTPAVIAASKVMLQIAQYMGGMSSTQAWEANRNLDVLGAKLVESVRRSKLSPEERTDEAKRDVEAANKVFKEYGISPEVGKKLLSSPNRNRIFADMLEGGAVIGDKTYAAPDVTKDAGLVAALQRLAVIQTGADALITAANALSVAAEDLSGSSKTNVITIPTVNIGPAGSGR